MKELHCPVCGGAIVCTYERTNLYFFINEQGNVERDENPDLWFEGHYHFHCSNDKEHDIRPLSRSKSFEDWCKEFKNNIEVYIGD